MALAYADTIDKYAKANNLDPALVTKLIQTESSGNPRAVSPKGARGLMQLMPGTASDMGVKDPHDPEQNIAGGTKYLANLHQQFGGDTRLALAAWNWGPENVKKDPTLKTAPKETHNLINKVMGGNNKMSQTSDITSNDLPSRMKTAGFSPKEISDVIAQKRQSALDSGFKEEELPTYLRNQQGGGATASFAPTPDETSFFGGVKHGLKQTGMGALQAVLQGGQEIRKATGQESNQPSVDWMQQMIDKERSSYRPANWKSTAGEIVGGTLTTLPMKGESSLVGGVIGALQPTSEGDSRTINALKGAGFGKLSEFGLGAIGKTYNAVKGNVSNAVRDLGDKFNIPTTLGEETGKPFTQWVESMQEKIPWLGIGKFRARQNQAASDAAKNYLANYAIGSDPINSMAENREFASSIYNEMKTLLPGIEEQQIIPKNTKGIADSLLKRYPDVFKKFQDTKTENLLKDIASGAKGGKGQVQQVMPSTGKPIAALSEKNPIYTESGGVDIGRQFAGNIPESERVPIGPWRIPGRTAEISPSMERTSGIRSGQAVTREIKQPQNPLTFDEMWTLRQGLGEKIGQVRAAIARKEVGYDETLHSQLKSLHSAVSNDMENWANSIHKPEITKAFNSANDAFKNNVVKYGVLQRAWEKAAGPNPEVGKLFSPQKFSNALSDIIKKDKVYNQFTKSEISEMSGLANIMQVVKASGQYMANPQTGARLTIPALGAVAEDVAYHILGAKTAMGTGGVAIAGTAVAKFLTSTTMGKNFALAASKVEPQSLAMQMIVKGIYSSLPKAAAVAASQPESTKEQPPQKTKMWGE